jgi:hypothetical protein
VISAFLNKKDHSLAWKSIPSPKTWDHSHTFLSCFCRDRSVSYRLVTFYINMLMPKLFKHVNCPANFFSAFDKPCIPLKTSMKSLFMSRNGHDKSVWEWSHVLGEGMDFFTFPDIDSTHRKESTLTVYQRSEWYVVISTNQLKYITVNVVRQEN